LWLWGWWRGSGWSGWWWWWGGCPGGSGCGLFVGESTAEELLDCVGFVFFVAAEDVVFLHTVESQFVYLYVGPEGDEPHQRILRQQIQRLCDTVRQLTQLLRMTADIHHEQKRRRTRIRNTRQLILRRWKHQLRRQILLVDILRVQRGEVVPAGAKGADPEFGAEIHLAVRVEDGLACDGGAADRFVGEGGGWGGCGGEFGDGGDEGAEGGGEACGFEAGGGPGVEGEAGSVGLFEGGYVPPLILHFGCCA